MVAGKFKIMKIPAASETGRGRCQMKPGVNCATKRARSPESKQQSSKNVSVRRLTAKPALARGR